MKKILKNAVTPENMLYISLISEILYYIIFNIGYNINSTPLAFIIILVSTIISMFPFYLMLCDIVEAYYYR